MAMTEQQLRERLRKISALFEGAATAGERGAAAAALERVKQSLETLPPSSGTRTSFTEPLIEMQFSLADLWQRRLLTALCRRYGLAPYRYRRQRHTTLMVRVKRSFLDQILWPEYTELRNALDEYLAAATDRIIREEVFSDAREAQETPD
jgi:hypothetical protein